MKKITGGRLLASALLLQATAILGANATTTDPASIPAEAFSDNPLLWAPKLSPSGDALAVEMTIDEHRVLAVIDTATLKKVKVVARFAGTDVVNAHWVNNNRLVFEQNFENGVDKANTAPGLFAVDRDGENQRRLIRSDWTSHNEETRTHIKDRTLTADYSFLQTISDNSSDVIVQHLTVKANQWDALHTIPVRLDTLTGLTRKLLDSSPPEHTLDWVIDDQGQVRATFTSDEGQTTMLTPDAGKWRTIARFPYHGPDSDMWSSLTAAADGQLYVQRSSDTPEATRGLHRFDMATGTPEASALLRVKGFDIVPTLIEDHCRHKVLGIQYHADAWSTAWLDPAMAAAQAKIDALLPGRANLVDVASCGNGAPLLVTSSSDRTPEQYYLYDVAGNSLRFVATSRPKIEPALMADTDFFRIKARDGREFPVYVTRPHGKGPFPTVVLVHGGPNVRGWSWEWDDESQFLASRGYLVVKPEFRGSAGYGLALENAGYRQWGLTMQDDIADATRWAQSQGWSDAKRTCIAGASYGGYATLMGLIRYPELYRCGVASSAVADIDLMYATWWNDISDETMQYRMPVTIGDRVKDAAQFAATSPVKLAARIKQPLLLAHGGLDSRVPIEQANAMRSALQANHAALTWLFYADEGHGFYIQKDRADFYRREADFLAANIGPSAPALAAVPAGASTSN
jgi:dienelactone hydrolase